MTGCSGLFLILGMFRTKRPLHELPDVVLFPKSI